MSTMLSMFIEAHMCSEADQCFVMLTNRAAPQRKTDSFIEQLFDLFNVNSSLRFVAVLETGRTVMLMGS
jgi:hypothetical protein